MFRHGFWLVCYEVAPLVGAEHTGTIMHADVRAHGVRVVHKVPTMRTEDLLNRRAVRVNLRTTQRQNGMERRQSQHLRPEALVVGWKRIVVFIKETRQNVVKLKVLHIAIRRRLERLVATDVSQRVLEIRVKELRILVAIQDAFYAFETLLDVGVAVQYGQYVSYHRVHVAVIPGVLRQTPTKVLHPRKICTVVVLAKSVEYTLTFTGYSVRSSSSRGCNTKAEVVVCVPWASTCTEAPSSTASMNCISSSSSSIEMAAAEDEPGVEEVAVVGLAVPSSLGRFTVG